MFDQTCQTEKRKYKMYGLSIKSEQGSMFKEIDSLRILNGIKEVLKRDKRFRIIIPLFQNEKHRRFAIGQELGHLFLHMGYLTSNKLWDRQLDNTRLGLSNAEQAYQSNEFAMAFLMPRAEYKRVLDENTVGTKVDTRSVAEYFGVRIAIASLRGQSLGYLK